MLSFYVAILILLLAGVDHKPIKATMTIEFCLLIRPDESRKNFFPKKVIQDGKHHLTLIELIIKHQSKVVILIDIGFIL